MVAAIAKFRCRTGIQRLNESDTLDVSVECYTDLNPSGEGGIERVDFLVTENGVPVGTTSVSSPSLRYPNHSTARSPLVGARDTTMAPFYGYGITLACADYDQGVITVTAKVYSNLGTETQVLDQDGNTTITLYNDKGGADSRPNTDDIYVGSTGWPGASDSNPGTDPLLPKATIRAGIGSGDVGGKNVILLPGAHPLLGTYSSPASLYTSGHWWCNVIALPGAVLTRQEPYPNFILNAVGNGPGTALRLRWVGDAIWHDNGMSYFIGFGSGVTVNHWMDGGFSGAANYDAEKPWSVLYAGRGATGPVGVDGDSTKLFKHVTCHEREGVTLGFAGWDSIQDVKIADYQGIAFNPSGNEGDTICNALVERHRYAEKDVLGYLDLLPNTTCLLTVPSAGVLQVTAIGVTRLTLNGTPTGEIVDIAEQVAELVGQSDWQLLFSNFQTGNNGLFPVTEVGTSGGLPYFRVTCPSAVAGFPPVGSRIQTANSSGTLYTTVVHTDIIQAFSNRAGSLWSNIATRDTRNTRGYVDENFGGQTLTRCALVNCGAVDAEGNSDWSSTLVDCLFLHNSFHFWQFAGGVTANSGCNFVDNVCDHQNNFPSGGFKSHNHFISGSTSGSDASTGSWYDGDPTEDPWSLEPSSGNVGTSSGLLPAPAVWCWDGANDSRGVWTNVGGHDATEGASFIAAAFGDIAVGAPAASMAVPALMTTDAPATVRLGGPEGVLSKGEAPVQGGEATRSSIGGGSTGGGQERPFRKNYPNRDMPVPQRNGSVKMPPTTWRSKEAKGRT